MHLRRPRVGSSAGNCRLLAHIPLRCLVIRKNQLKTTELLKDQPSEPWSSAVCNVHLSQTKATAFRECSIAHVRPSRGRPSHPISVVADACQAVSMYPLCPTREHLELDFTAVTETHKTCCHWLQRVQIQHVTKDNGIAIANANKKCVRYAHCGHSMEHGPICQQANASQRFWSPFSTP